MGTAEVEVSSLEVERFRGLLGDDYAEVEAAALRARDVFRERTIWHLNSTARGGGVTELLHSLLAYTRGAGVESRWRVVEGDERFFAVTKRLHNRLHGAEGDGGPLGEEERDAYDATLAEAAAQLRELVRPGDVVFCHDPQTAGLVPALADAGVSVVWRCHIGVDEPNELARSGWEFLRPYLGDAAAYVFSREQFVWEGIDPGRVWIVPPSIDAFSPKNQDLDAEQIGAILGAIGLAEPNDKPPEYALIDGSPRRVGREAAIVQDGPLPPGAPVLAQVSRWDRLKDPEGVLAGFAEHLSDSDAHLVLAGPEVSGVADDPEAAAVLGEARRLRQRLAPAVRARTHLVSLPMADTEENAAMVNAIQRRAAVIIQKSLAEGFGLTITEGMWKGRPVVASCRGAIQEMIEDGVSGVLLADPADLPAFARECDELLADRVRAERIGAAARERVIDRFLGTRHLVQYLHLIEGLLEDGDGR